MICHNPARQIMPGATIDAANGRAVISITVATRNRRGGFVDRFAPQSPAAACRAQSEREKTDMGTERHRRDVFYLAESRRMVGAVDRPATPSERQTSFRFSQLVPRTAAPDSDELLRALAEAMVTDPPEQDGDVPAGFTYLGQFIDHDLTRDVTKVPFNTAVTADQLQQGRSPSLDLDSVYGLGPDHPADGRLYQADRARLKLGATAAVQGFPRAEAPLDGFDLPRVGAMAQTEPERRMADIPDPRNDENLAIAQIHLAFMRFHNATVNRLAAQGTPSALLFEAAREDVVKHYQWMLIHDYLPRIVDRTVLTDVLTNGRRIVEPEASGGPAMPIEFSVAAFRFGHSMIRAEYDWNQFFHPRKTTARAPGTLENLFRFTGTSGNFTPGSRVDETETRGFEQLPGNWIIDWARFFDFPTDAGRPDLAPSGDAALNLARRIDTRLTDPLVKLPLGSFGGRGDLVPDGERNLAFRNLVRARMVGLASAQDVAAHFASVDLAVTALTRDELLTGAGGVDLAALAPALQDQLVAATPLWFYVLREAELRGGKLGEIGGRIVAETFHLAIEGSRISLLRDPAWRPVIDGVIVNDFKMVDLLLQAFDASKGELHPLDPSTPTPALAAAPT
jgi:hypothetical protein